ncbi:MAG: folE [Bacteroidetes bacterium]|nr:folE [Bacteroidota bacterium]
MEDLVRDLLKEIGEDASREGLARTPERVARMYKFFTKGYSQDIKELFNGAIFKSCSTAPFSKKSTARW